MQAEVLHACMQVPEALRDQAGASLNISCLGLDTYFSLHETLVMSLNYFRRCIVVNEDVVHLHVLTF